MPLSGTQGPKARWGGQLVRAWQGAESAVAFSSVSGSLEKGVKGNGAGAGNRKEVQGEQETGFWVRELNQSVE